MKNVLQKLAKRFGDLCSRFADLHALCKPVARIFLTYCKYANRSNTTLQNLVYHLSETRSFLADRFNHLGTTECWLRAFLCKGTTTSFRDFQTSFHVLIIIYIGMSDQISRFIVPIFWLSEVCVT